MKRQLLTVLIATSLITACNARARILENGSISTIDLTGNEFLYYQPGDTVWVNLSTHRIDDKDSSAMLAEIQIIY